MGKLTADDTSIFMGLLNDLFPKTAEHVPRALDTSFEAKVTCTNYFICLPHDNCTAGILQQVWQGMKQHPVTFEGRLPLEMPCRDICNSPLVMVSKVAMIPLVQVREAAEELGYQATETFCLKVSQLREIFSVRWSVFLLGPAGCGKTAIWRTLLRAQQLLGEKTLYKPINPKASPDSSYALLYCA